MALITAWRIRLSFSGPDAVFSSPTRFSNDGAVASLMPDAPFSDANSWALSWRANVASPERSSCALVVACGTWRKTTCA